MGVLNLTPDSFYDGGRYETESSFLKRTEEMLQQGATFIDVGGMSSRPGAEMITVDEELKRVLPAIEAIHRRFPEAIISIDTIRAEVVRKAVDAGASVVNDISAGAFDEELYLAVAEKKTPYILMHMQGTPLSMQDRPEYKDPIVEIMDFFIQEVTRLRRLGVKDIILDPGFGFGKTVAHNYQLLRALSSFKILDCPVLAGLSRKSMICKVLKVNPDKALNGTTALNMVALLNGASILRVHDVREAMETVKLWEQLQNA
jgi:dihydropteroate synthase